MFVQNFFNATLCEIEPGARIRMYNSSKKSLIKNYLNRI